MTREEAIKFAEYAQIMADGKPDVQEFYKLAESALRQQETVTNRNEPLTMDELREMPIRDWVWIDVLHLKEAISSYYRKYDGYKKDEIFWCGYPGLGFRFFYEDYGKTWLAYRQKPEEDKHENLD